MSLSFWWVGILLPTIIVVIWNLWIWKNDLHCAHKLHSCELINPEPVTELPTLVSFLIPAWNEQNNIKRCIEAVISLPFSNLEIIVCAGGNDDTYDIAKSHRDTRIKVLEQLPGEGKQVALQRCFQASRGEIIYLTDADCIIETAVFIRTISPILSGDEQAVSGSFYLPVFDHQHNPFVYSQAATVAYAAAHHKGKYSEGLLGGNCAFTRSALILAGEFKNAVLTGTDYDLAIRLRRQKINIRFIVLGWIRAEYKTAIKPYLRQQTRWIRNVVIHGRNSGDSFLVKKYLLASVIGSFMLIFPIVGCGIIAFEKNLASIVSIFAIIWFSLFLHAVLSRFRYIYFFQYWFAQNIPLSLNLILPFFILLDFFTWTIPIFEYGNKSLRQRW